MAAFLKWLPLILSLVQSSASVLIEKYRAKRAEDERKRAEAEQKKREAQNDGSKGR